MKLHQLKQWSQIYKRSKGFSLIELIIAMAVMSVAIGVIFYAYLATTRLMTSEVEDSDVTFEVNKAMDRISKELRNTQEITAHNSNSITFWYDDTNNNNTREATETATFYWTGGTIEAIFRTVVSTTERIANNIANMTLTYDATTEISRITISITGNKNNTISTSESSVNCRNL